MNQNFRPQSQVCGRVGHTAMICFHRFDRRYQQSPSESANSQSSFSIDHPPPPPSYYQPRVYLATPSTLTDSSWLIILHMIPRSSISSIGTTYFDKSLFT
ncbi:uncharacterized protein DS421_5g146460 [Arachis hypogaea]|nr:uncharacterized protein DS421_5g146460 [Arachis hypogaea]